jgi:hypothetical protein
MKAIVNPKHPDLIGVQAVQVLHDFTVHITFADGTEGDIDLEPHLFGPVFEPIRRDPKLFASISVDAIGQTLTWPGDIELAFETLYSGDKPPPWVTDPRAKPRNKKQPRAKNVPSAKARRRATTSRRTTRAH